MKGKAARKQMRIQASARHVEDAEWWFQTCDRCGLLPDKIEQARVGSRMGRYYLGVARAIRRRMLPEKWVRQVGITKASVIAEEILRRGKPIPRSILWKIADPTITVRLLKRQMGPRPL